MKAMRSSHIFTSACLSVHNTPSKFPFQPLDIHFGKNYIENAMAIKDKIEGQTQLTSEDSLFGLLKYMPIKNDIIIYYYLGLYQLLIYLVATQMSENRHGANQVGKSEIATKKTIVGSSSRRVNHLGQYCICCDHNCSPSSSLRGAVILPPWASVRPTGSARQQLVLQYSDNLEVCFFFKALLAQNWSGHTGLNYRNYLPHLALSSALSVPPTTQKNCPESC